MLVEVPDSKTIIDTLTELQSDFDEAYDFFTRTKDTYDLCVACAHGSAFSFYKSFVDADRVYDFMARRH